MVECTVILYLLKFVLCLIALSFLIVIGVRLWLHPVKGICKCKTKLYGKTALVTGGNSGIGRETARDLARRGARVIIAARNVEKSNEAVANIIATTNNSHVYFMSLDLSKFSSIKQFADNFSKTYDRLDILVNNAGAAGLNQGNTEDGIEKIMQINYVGPFLLTRLLMDKLKSSNPSRIVIVSSKGHCFHKLDTNDLTGQRPLDFWVRYANSKICNVLWMKALAKRLPDGITVNALEPGLVMTDIFHRYSALYKAMLHFVLRVFFKSAEEGAQTCIHLCVATELERVSGSYFKECKIETPHKTAQNDEIVNVVWEKTMLLIKDAL